MVTTACGMSALVDFVLTTTLIVFLRRNRTGFTLYVPAGLHIYISLTNMYIL